MRNNKKVRAERLELSHLAALDPKSSVSTNSTTPAIWSAKINNTLKIKYFLNKKFIMFCTFTI